MRILLLSTARMRAAAIVGLGCSPQDLKPFQTANHLTWRMGVPASKDEADVVLLFGGDGTIHRHLGPLVRLGLPVLVVPAGSGNDFAHALGLGRVRDSLGSWRRFVAGAGNIRSIDLGLISPGENPVGAAPAEYFCGVAHVGLDAEVARRANTLPRWLRGHGGYLLSLAPAIVRFTPVPLRVLIPSDDLGWKPASDRPTTLAAFGNTARYGDGMRIAPRAKVDDGLLDVCVVGRVDPLKLLCMLPTVYLGRHLGIREVDYFQAARVRVEAEAPVEVYADGEYVGRTPVEISIVRSALPVIAP